MGWDNDVDKRIREPAMDPITGEGIAEAVEAISGDVRETIGSGALEPGCSIVRLMVRHGGLEALRATGCAGLRRVPRGC